MAKFQKGLSGNPAGRKPGTAKTAKLRESLLKSAPGIIDQLIVSALNGDIQAAKIVLERVIPSLKPGEQPVFITLSGNLVVQGEAVIAAVGSGTITPTQAQSLMAALAIQARLIESIELAERLERLEKLMENKK